MRYNGIHASSFEHVKVTSWKNSFYSDFDRREVTSRGVVLASVEVPTIRKIQVSILVKGKNVREIETKLQRMAEWLFSAGTAKLFSDRDPNNYFKARCTAISQPEYSGLSARFTVTFTCADYKLYSARTDMPNGTQNAELSNFTFAGKHCLNDMGMLFIEESRDAIPEIRARKYEITGGTGTLRYSDGIEIDMAERVLQGTLYLVNRATPDGMLSEQEIAERLHNAAAWLVNAERSELFFDSDPDVIYTAEIESAIPFTRTGWENGLLKLRFVMQPLGRDRHILTATGTMNFDVYTSQKLDLTPLLAHGMGYTTPLNVSLYNGGLSIVTSVVIGYRDRRNWQKVLYIQADNYEFAFAYGQTLSISETGKAELYTGSPLSGSTDLSKFVKWGEVITVSPNSLKELEFSLNALAKNIQVTVQSCARFI